MSPRLSILNVVNGYGCHVVTMRQFDCRRTSLQGCSYNGDVAGRELCKMTSFPGKPSAFRHRVINSFCSVSPSFAICNAVDNGRTNPKFFGDLTMRLKIGLKFGFYIFNRLIRQFGVPVFFSVSITGASFFSAIFKVIEMCAQKKMGRATARWIVAVMADVFRFIKRAIMEQVGNTRSIVVSPIVIEFTIATIIYTAYPRPALAKIRTVWRHWPIFVNLFPKAFLRCFHWVSVGGLNQCGN